MNENPTTLDQLQADPNNPRILSQHDGEALAKSMAKFGDLGGIVWNRKLGKLVGGHQRTEVIKKLLGGGQIVVSEALENPDAVGTVAYGYVENNGRRFSIRIVEWDEGFHTSANVAANRISADFDEDKLAENVRQLNELQDPDLLALTGLTNAETKKLLQLSSAPEEPQDDNDGKQRITFAITDEQAEVVNRAITTAKSMYPIEGVNTETMNGYALYQMANLFLSSSNQQQ